MTAHGCLLCAGACEGADLGPLLAPELAWLWTAVADAADRRGDPAMVEGPAVTVVLPAGPAERSAVAGLVTGTRPGQRARVGLGALARMVGVRGAGLTPGDVAAHATRRRLALRATEARSRQHRFDAIRDALCAACEGQPDLAGQGAHLYEHLRRSGWVARLDAAGIDAVSTVTRAISVVGTLVRLPEGERIDRRLLVPEDPHALDDGTPLAGATLALLVADGRISTDTDAPARSLWAQAGVDCDDLMGGLTVLGIVPDGWALPAQATCTIPPRELARADWPAPLDHDDWVFVTENPSVLAAAADLAARDPDAGPVRLICTMGTPSAAEVAGLARIAAAGWQVAVRADFDAAGISHVTAILAGVPGAIPWRMDVAHYDRARPAVAANAPTPATPWDPALHDRMTDTGLCAFEEALLPDLLRDLRCGQPDARESRRHGAAACGEP